MARPSAKTVIEIQTNRGVDKYLAVEAIYGLTYQGELVSIRRETVNIRGTGVKYPKTQWPNEGSARNVVRKLNEQYMTEDFGYICLYKSTNTQAVKPMTAVKNQSYEAN